VIFLCGGSCGRLFIVELPFLGVAGGLLVIFGWTPGSLKSTGPQIQTTYTLSDRLIRGIKTIAADWRWHSDTIGGRGVSLL
jgi:hypothetical protein